MPPFPFILAAQTVADPVLALMPGYAPAAAQAAEIHDVVTGVAVAASESRDGCVPRLLRLSAIQ